MVSRRQGSYPSQIEIAKCDARGERHAGIAPDVLVGLAGTISVAVNRGKDGSKEIAWCCERCVTDREAIARFKQAGAERAKAEGLPENFGTADPDLRRLYYEV